MTERDVPTWVTMGDVSVMTSLDRPRVWENLRENAVMVDDVVSTNPDSGRVVMAFHTGDADWPQLVVEVGYWPTGSGFSPGVLVVPETSTAFVGAGTTLLAYRIGEQPQWLWEDAARVGFWGWRRRGDVVLMSAELELAAWDLEGNKLWSRFVEPPWSYEVRGDVVDVDVMGTVTVIGLADGEPQG